MAKMITTFRSDNKLLLNLMSKGILKTLESNEGSKLKVKMVVNTKDCIRYITEGKDIENVHKGYVKYYQKHARRFKQAGVKVECKLE